MDKDCLRYLERVRQLNADFVYQVIQIDTDIFDKQKVTTSHLTTSAYYRLIIADLIKEYDKCMYHDGDILVLEDLQEMFNVDLEGYYVAGVKWWPRHQETEENIKVMKAWNFPSFDNYIISGDLVLNLSKMREDRITDEFIKQMYKGYPSEDQDVINYCCYGKIYFLPLKFGMVSRWLYNDGISRMKKQVYDSAEINKAKSSPAIVHFAGGIAKPWNNVRAAYGDKWWGYAKKILSEEDYLVWFTRAEKLTRGRDWEDLKYKTDRYKTIAIFGCGKMGKMLLPIFRNWGYDVKCFIDNDINKQEKMYEGCEVLSIDTASIGCKSMVIVNSVRRYRSDIREQLISRGVDSERIIDFDYKNQLYYMALAPQYYEYEYRDIFVKEFGWRLDKCELPERATLNVASST